MERQRRDGLRDHTSALQPLATLVALTLRRAGLGRVVLMSRLLRHWEEIIGPQLAAVAQPEAVRSRVLFVTVTDDIWLQQLMFYQSQLLQNIRNVLGEVSITRLHFSLASSLSPPRGRRGDARPESSEPEAAGAADPLPLTTAEEQQVVAGTEGIADPELRDAARRAWRVGWQAGRRKA
jgi:predicted nucleic acid-binding Zn ribbon protein